MKEDKKPLPPNAGPPTDHDADKVEIVKEVAANRKRLTVGLAVGTAVLVVVIGASMLGVFLSKDPNIVTGNRLWKVNEVILNEKIEVDIKAKTETFYTKDSDGTSALMHDTNTGLSAYKFEMQKMCYITDYEKDQDSEEVDNLAQRMEDGEDGEVEVAQQGPSEYLSVDNSREPFNRSSLSDKMDEFCGPLETQWGVKTAEEPGTPGVDPTSIAGDSGNMEGEPQERKKRVICRWVRKWVCKTVCTTICGRKKRTAEQEKEGEENEQQPTRVKRFWGGRRRRRWFSCPRVCYPRCNWILRWIC
ncbi:uncharacterized protein LOC144921026 [Branchiostoma floridae x Branchiostoma belcheri]